jgi:antibiotic biosynthesis monooxygenase
MNRTKKTLLITVGLAALTLTAVALGRDRHPHCDGPSTQKNAVVLINTFSVPAGKEAAALASWQKARDFLQTQPGYLGTRLHQNLDPNGTYHLVNVARWQSAEAFKAATEKMRAALPDNQVEGVIAQPGLFKVIDSDMPKGFGGGFGRGCRPGK